MRLLAIAVIGLSFALAPAPLSAGDQDSKKAKPTAKADVDKRILTAKEIQEYLTPYVAKIDGCYNRHGLKQKKSTGDLKIEMVIHRNGSIHRTQVYAPGVPGKALKKCIEKLSKDWSFPPRKQFTHAIIPFFYLQTKTPGAGPQHSCWNPRGCPKKRAKQRRRFVPAKKGDAKKGDAKKPAKGDAKKKKPAKGDAKK